MIGVRPYPVVDESIYFQKDAFFFILYNNRFNRQIEKWDGIDFFFSRRGSLGRIINPSAKLLAAKFNSFIDNYFFLYLH